MTEGQRQRILRPFRELADSWDRRAVASDEAAKTPGLSTNGRAKWEARAEVMRNRAGELRKAIYDSERK